MNEFNKSLQSALWAIWLGRCQACLLAYGVYCARRHNRAAAFGISQLRRRVHEHRLAFLFRFSMREFTAGK